MVGQMVLLREHPWLVRAGPPHANSRVSSTREEAGIECGGPRPSCSPAQQGAQGLAGPGSCCLSPPLRAPRGAALGRIWPMPTLQRKAAALRPSQGG